MRQIKLFETALLFVVASAVAGHCQTPLKDRACVIQDKAPANARLTIIVARVKVDGVEKLYISANPGSTGGNKPITLKKWQEICKKKKTFAVN